MFIKCRTTIEYNTCLDEWTKPESVWVNTDHIVTIDENLTVVDVNGKRYRIIKPYVVNQNMVDLLPQI